MLLFDVVEDRVAVPVGQERQLVQSLDRREDVVHHAVANRHLIEVVLVLGEIRGQSLHDPQRHPRPQRPAQVALEEQRVLEDVHQLVRDQLVELVRRRVDGQHHAVLHRLGERGDALGQLGQRDVGLLELAVRLVDDQRHAKAQLVVQLLADLQVGALRVGDDLFEERLQRRVVVHVEMRGLVDSPVERLVRDLVLAELAPGRQGGRYEQHGNQREARENSVHEWLLIPSVCILNF